MSRCRTSRSPISAPAPTRAILSTSIRSSGSRSFAAPRRRSTAAMPSAAWFPSSPRILPTTSRWLARTGSYRRRRASTRRTGASLARPPALAVWATGNRWRSIPSGGVTSSPQTQVWQQTRKIIAPITGSQKSSTTAWISASSSSPANISGSGSTPKSTPMKSSRRLRSHRPPVRASSRPTASIRPAASARVSTGVTRPIFGWPMSSIPRSIGRKWTAKS